MPRTRIAVLRRQAGTSQKKSARRLNGSTSADRLVKIAALFGISKDDLLTGVPAGARDKGSFRALRDSACRLLPVEYNDLIALLSALLGN